MLRAYLALPRLIHVLVFGAFVNRAGAFVMPFLALYVSGHLRLGPRVAALALGAFGIGSLGGSLIGGQLADRWGRRTVMAGSLFGTALMLLLLSRARSGPEIVVATLLLALISDMYRPAVQAFIADVVPAQQRVHAFALIYMAINLGFAVAPVAGGMLAERSYSLLFYVDASTSAAFGLLILFALPETLPEVTPSERLRQNDAFLPAMRQVLSHRLFVLFCVGLFLVTLTFAQAFSTLPLFMAELGVGQKTYGRIIAINGIMIVVCQVFVTSFAARVDRALALSLSAVLIGAGFGLNAFVSTPVGLVASVVVWTLGEMVQAPLVGSVTAELAPVRLRARYMSLTQLSFATAAALGAPLGGHLLGSIGSRKLWLLVALVAFVGAALDLTLRRALSAHRARETPSVPPSLV